MLLRERQAERPTLSARVPSLLDAVTYWYTLRAQGDKLDDSSAFDKTYIRHFDLEPQTVGGWQFVPCSYVDSAMVSRAWAVSDAEAGVWCSARGGVKPLTLAPFFPSFSFITNYLRTIGSGYVVQRLEYLSVPRVDCCLHLA
jgi:hypothetical protein